MRRAEIIDEAERWTGTPYCHQASLNGAGCDCLGLVRGIWRALIGPEPQTLPAYTPDWAEALGEETLLQGARAHLVERPPGSALPGDVLIFRMGMGVPAKHCGVLAGPDRLIHAYWGRAVTATRLSPWWSRRVVAAFSFPGLED
jgi:NlpC/P60 family putative phage cell wall peptidase